MRVIDIDPCTQTDAAQEADRKYKDGRRFYKEGRSVTQTSAGAERFEWLDALADAVDDVVDNR